MVSSVGTIPRKTSNDFYSYRARDSRALLVRAAAQFIASDLWPPNSADLNPVNHRVIEAWCRSRATARRYSTLPTDRGGAWLLHGPVHSSTSSTRRSTAGVDGCVSVWELMGNTSSTSSSLPEQLRQPRTSPSDDSNDRWKHLCLVSWAAAPCVWTLRAPSRNFLNYLLTCLLWQSK